MKNVFGYIRVSTAKQGEGVSLIAQKEAIERYANQYSLTISQWFEEKETAAKQGRPLFSVMMKLLQARKVHGVIIHKIDRSARNLKDWADIASLIDQGVEVHFAHESLDLQGRGGRLSADIQAVIAADYIRNLRQEAIKGIYGRLKQGVYPFQAPTGYLNTGRGKYKIIDPVQGPLVRKGFELYATRKHTLHSLTEHMRRLGLKNLRGGKIAVNVFSKILNNPFYAGIIKVKGQTFNGGHEPLISPILFKRVQMILRGNTNQRVNKHEFIFSKLLKCKGCGFSLIGEIQKGRTYYRCHTKNCITKGVREIAVENILLNTFSKAQLYPQEVIKLKGLLGYSEQESQIKQQEMYTAVRLQKKQLDQKLDRLLDFYLEEGLDKETYERRKEKLLFESKTKEAAENELRTEDGKIYIRVRNFLELSMNLIKSYKNGILEERKDLVHIVTSNLTVEGKKLTISMRSPFLEVAERFDLCFGEPIVWLSELACQRVYLGLAIGNLRNLLVGSY
jgi:site-specific DNA recombinase